VISTPEALHAFLEPMSRAGRIGLDTEADSLHCYFEKLCLIQISIPGHDVLIDPLAPAFAPPPAGGEENPAADGLPVAPGLQPLFAELARHELIIQGLDYDLRLLRRAGMTSVGGVFDTMIAARLAGIAEFSLAALIQQFFGLTLAKGSQKANWARRPLSPEMEEYARNDTRYLAELADRLEGELVRLGRFDWMRQSCERAIETVQTDREKDADTLWRIPGSGELRGRAAAVMRELWAWRDGEARRADRPPFHIAHNERLIETAKRLAAGESAHIAHLNGSRLRRFREAAERALALPESDWPKFIRIRRARPTPEMDARFADFKARRDAAAEAHRLDPSLIASKSVLEAIAADPEPTLARLLPWQRMLLGVA
jgi:ribonuclease D